MKICLQGRFSGMDKLSLVVDSGGKDVDYKDYSYERDVNASLEEG